VRAECFPHVVRRLALTAATLAVFGLPAALAAQKADRSQPIQLEADKVVVDDARQIATFTGNVVLTQGSLVIRGERMEVRQDKQGFRHGTTWGNLAYFRQRRPGTDEVIEGWAERIEYDGRAERVQMFNRALMKRGADEVRGNYISYDATSELFQASGTAGAKTGEGRVRAILQPRPGAGGSPEPGGEDRSATKP
jgi:lipopolysaccharide export system protein LptA